MSQSQTPLQFKIPHSVLHHMTDDAQCWDAFPSDELRHGGLLVEGEQLTGNFMWQAEKAAERKGEAVSKDAFDSNCITPGTPFMERLGAHLRFFIRRKIAEDPAWREPTIVFSGARFCHYSDETS